MIDCGNSLEMNIWKKIYIQCLSRQYTIVHLPGTVGSTEFKPSGLRLELTLTAALCLTEYLP